MKNGELTKEEEEFLTVKKLSGLQRIALRDLKRVQQSKEVFYEPSDWMGSGEGSCWVCDAGAVAYFGLNRRMVWFPDRVGEPKLISHRMHAIDYLRQGRLVDAQGCLCSEHDCKCSKISETLQSEFYKLSTIAPMMDNDEENYDALHLENAIKAAEKRAEWLEAHGL